MRILRYSLSAFALFCVIMESVYTRSKRMEEERALERAEKKKQFEELVRKIREEAENGNDDVLWPL